MSETNVGRSGSNAVTITVIIVAGAIILACILSFTGITMAFFLNPPW